MNIVDIIIKKRNKEKLTKDEMDFFVASVVNDTTADYQISAMLMAMYLNHLDDEETVMLTKAMTYLGKIFDLSEIEGIKVDKHSTGGVGDTTTLILAPLVASTGVPVIKMSGRGLGFSGGTLDKLEAIPGFKCNVCETEAIKYGKKSGIVIMSQSEEITPADRKFYALRDVTGTVDSIPLIVSSIMSKKIAAGADAIVLDIKCGNGAFMKDFASAKELAEKMTEIGKGLNKKVTAIISNMNQPLGKNVGNSLEVIEAIEILKGNISSGDLLEVSLTIGAHMLLNAKKVDTIENGKALLKENIVNKKGLNKLRELIIQQNGNPNVLEDYSLFGTCAFNCHILSEAEGYITAIDTESIGKASIESGAGRKTKSDILDYNAGIITYVRLGDYIKKGEPLVTVYASSKEKCNLSAEYLKTAISIGAIAPQKENLILDII